MHPHTHGIFLLVGSSLALLVPLLAAVPLPPLPPGRMVEVYAQKIHYYEAGDGPAVILLHGLGLDASFWVLQIPALARSHRVYAVDMLGFGRSDKPPLEYSIETFVEFLEGFMRQAGIPKATLVGLSLGGWIAADFAAQHPEMVERLVLVDAAGIRPPVRLTEAMLALLNPGSLAEERNLLEFVLYNKELATEEFVEMLFTHRMRSGNSYTVARVIHRMLTRDEWVNEKLASVHAPALVVWGRQDMLLPLALGEEYARLLPGAKLVVIDDCGHLPPAEKPAEFAKAVVEFLAQPLPASSAPC
jgi:2-hydroxy-6-oxonona-2,4-dienedioate hydrolase